MTAPNDSGPTVVISWTTRRDPAAHRLLARLLFAPENPLTADTKSSERFADGGRVEGLGGGMNARLST